MCKSQGYNVVKLKRIRIVNINLDKLPMGEYRHVSDEELTELIKLLEKSQERHQ